MPTVYLPHKPNRKVSVEGALRYGKIVQVFKDEDRALGDTQLFLDKARKIMASISEGDYVIAMGDPVLSNIVSGVMAEQLGLTNFLVWDNRQADYFPVTVDYEASPRDI